jgi:hypothetical protein
MIDVGDLRLRMRNEVALRTMADRTQVRNAYLIALVRAHRDGDLGGILRVAESFAKLDDDASLEHSLRIASSVAAHGSPETQEMYRVAALRLRSRGLAPRATAR